MVIKTKVHVIGIFKTSCIRNIISKSEFSKTLRLAKIFSKKHNITTAKTFYSIINACKISELEIALCPTAY
jgi:hypothetical protein